MSFVKQFSVFLVIIALTSMAGLSSHAGQPDANQNSRWATFEDAAGKQYFALSLQVKSAQDLPMAEESEVVVLFDTSASQTGDARMESLAVLDELASALPLNTKVGLMACDVETVTLSEGLVSATDSKWQLAVERLQKRAPLGVTDLGKALKAAAQQFSSASAQRTILYIGDGINRINFLTVVEQQKLVDELVEKHVTVSTLLIGPTVDVPTMAALVNHTGGVLLSRNEIQESTQVVGRALAGSVGMPVLWPTKVELPKALAGHQPKRFPPLRLERDTVVIGETSGVAAAGEMKFEGVTAGGKVQFTWKLKPEVSSPDMGFLPTLVSGCQADNGLSLAALGSAGLRALSFGLADSSSDMVKSGEFALKSGQVESALRIAEQALKNDPNNEAAKNLLEAAKKASTDIPTGKFMQTDNPFGDDPFGTPATPAPATPAPTTPAPATPVDDNPFGTPAVPASPLPSPEVTTPSEMVVPAAPVAPRAPATAAPATPAAPIGNYPPSLLDETIGAGNLLAQEESVRQVRSQAMEQHVRSELSNAQKSMSKNPLAVNAKLKALLEELDNAVDIDTTLRAQLRDQVRSNIQIAARQSSQYLDRIERQQAISSQADATTRLLAETNRTDDAIKQLVEQFNYLMTQRQFLNASKEISPEVERLAPDTPLSNVMRETSSLLANYSIVKKAFKDREQGFVDAMRGVEVAAIPQDEPPIVYPPAEVWQALSARRKERYGAINLAGGGKSEQKIYAALKQTTKELDWADVPLKQVIDELKNDHGIPIWLNEAELELAGLDANTPITIQIPPVTLRSALRLILQTAGAAAGADLTYIVRNEILQITTKEDADNEPLNKVYPVGDLVVTPQMLQMSGMGGMMGGMGGGMGGMGGGMGGMGGGMGGMGGGMGGMGGGMGGMGGGMGGMGGMFAVPDDTAKRTNQTRAPQTKVSTQSVEQLVERLANASTEELPKVEAEIHQIVERRVELANAYNEAKQVDKAKGEFQQIIDLVNGLLSAGYPQPWMYQALALSMEACNYPKADIKRVLLSGLDFDGSPSQAVKIARMFERKGMKREALELLHDVALVSPRRQDILVVALPMARELQDPKHLEWVCVGILSKVWPRGFESVFDQGVLASKETQIRLAKAGRIVESKAFEEATKQALRRDIVVRVNWTGNADLDVRVKEPTGSVCSLLNPETVAGGVLMGDVSSGIEKSSVDGFSEYYVCPEGFAGQYDVLVRRVWGEATGGKATVEIYTDYGTPNQKYYVKQIEVGDKDSMVQVAVKTGHRKETLAAGHLASTQMKQLEMAQQLLLADSDSPSSSSSSGSSSSENLNNFRQQVVNNNQIGFPGRGTVGYRPVITTIPSGASLNVAGVVSADRRYVRLAPSPQFQQIAEVTTFNFVTGQTAGGGAGTGTGGGGGGFGGGGGLGGGLGGGGPL